MRPRFDFLPVAALAAALLAIAAGCGLLPDGDPPEGDLTDNTPPPAVTPLAVRNHLATQLIVFALQNGVTELDPGADAEVVAVAADAARTAGFRLVRGAPLGLKIVCDRDGAKKLVALRNADQTEVWRSQRP